MQIKSEVLQNQKLNYKFHLIKLRTKKGGFNFKPGQFVTLKVTNSIFRCYSIASSPDTLPFWEMFIDITPEGPGTIYLKKLKKGDIIETSFPTGIFVHKKDGSKNIILAATGCGIAPLLPILKKVSEDKKNKNIILFWGLRFKKDIVFKDSLKKLAMKYPKFHYDIILSQQEEKWSGNTGHVQKHIIGSLQRVLPKETSLYLTGSGEFIEETLKDLQKTKLSPAHIYLEKYY